MPRNTTSAGAEGAKTELPKLIYGVDIRGMPLADIQKTREEKIAALRKSHADPYPPTSARTHPIVDALQRFGALAAAKDVLTLAGRMMLKREHGGATFFHFRDGSGAIQAYAKKDMLGAEAYAAFLELFDVGDFVEVEGPLFETKKGEKTIEARRIRMLAKSLRPLPEKWHGLQDVEERYRKRYLDLVMNPEVRERFITRSRLVGLLRDFFLQNGFMEVETPLLHTIPGGALAKPFETRLATLDLDLYLRVAPELYLKRLLIGGFDRVFEIGKCFRNEGMDKEHNPEFTECEAYAAYTDYEWLMAYTEHLFLHLIGEGLQKKHPIIAYADGELDLTTPWPRIEFNDALKTHAGLDFWENNEKDFREKVNELGLTVEKSPSKTALADELFKKIVRPKMQNPVFIINHPVELSPLAKNHRDDPRKVERFQLLAGGMEIANAFTELNDPAEQRRRFLEQEKERGRGDAEAMRFDEDFIEALEYGMPPAAGIGIGIDRMVRLLTDAPNLREVIAFPTMRPKS